MNKKKKGFTLIELLAVIVILAVIATPAVTHIIESTRKNSAEEYAEAINKVAINYYNSLLVEKNEVLALDLKDKEIDMTGTRPDKGRTYFSSKGFISATMYYSGYCLEVDETWYAIKKQLLMRR
ncbi:MAG: type II secretion system GspH family protein [Bacillales bacterium]|nr:type II secretion system GspH family protein [Bacillales bacterium]